MNLIFTLIASFYQFNTYSKDKMPIKYHRNLIITVLLQLHIVNPKQFMNDIRTDFEQIIQSSRNNSHYSISSEFNWTLWTVLYNWNDIEANSAVSWASSNPMSGLHTKLVKSCLIKYLKICAQYEHALIVIKRP